MRDDQIPDLLRSLEGDREPDPAFADALYATLDGEARRRPPRNTALVLLAAAALLLITIGAVVVGSGVVRLPVVVEASPTATPADPQPTQATSATASASPTTTSPIPTAPPPPEQVVAPPDGVLPLGSLLDVTADGLSVRDRPAITGGLLATVDAGDVLYVARHDDNQRISPIRADGYDWYFVLHEPGYRGWPSIPEGWPRTVEGVRGWVAVRSASETFVTLAPVECPGDVGITALTAMTEWARLACLGDRAITVEGTFGCGFCDSLAYSGIWEPAWLAHYLLEMNQFGPAWADRTPMTPVMVLTVPPETPPIENELAGSVLRVTGHFNDPRSADCVIGLGPPGEEVMTDDTAAEWFCREQFVVDAWDVIGSDADYPDDPSDL